MTEIENTLQAMCEYLASVQSGDGGFSCDACGFEHGRADNAVFPFVCCWSLTGDNAWLDRTGRLLDFREKLENPDGSVSNDFESPWKGITVFSAMALYKTIHFYGDSLPPELRNRIENKFSESAHWVHDNVKPGFKSNINYYCASAAVNAMYGSMYDDNEYTQRAKELISYCMNLFTENGILRGEGQPHDTITKNGCVPADIGYIVEEAIPCLVDAAVCLEDTACLMKLADYSCSLLDFMLPDGAWDNSFGSRNNKWTYYGSRTASGCTGAFAYLSKYRPVLYEAACRNLELIEKCSFKGALTGGREYVKYGQKICVHHTFSHAVAVADAISSGCMQGGQRCALQCDDGTNRVKYYKELKTYRIYIGNWIATVTGYDYGTYTRTKGAAHSSGGAVSMLYYRNCGPVIAGSVLEYALTETNNMQKPTGNISHMSLLPGVEVNHEGKKYSTSLYSDSKISVFEKDNNTGYVVKVIAKPESSDGKVIPGTGFCNFVYDICEDKIVISVEIKMDCMNAGFVLPVISSSGAEVVTENYNDKEHVFFLTGGFGAERYTFLSENVTVAVSIGKNAV